MFINPFCNLECFHFLKNVKHVNIYLEFGYSILSSQPSVYGRVSRNVMYHLLTFICARTMIIKYLKL